MTQTQTKPRPAAEEKLPSQYINYAFFKLSPGNRALPTRTRCGGEG